MTVYQKPADAITARIVSEFEDYEGWATSPPVTVMSSRLARAPAGAGGFDEPPEPRRAAGPAPARGPAGNSEQQAPTAAKQDATPVGLDTRPAEPREATFTAPQEPAPPPVAVGARCPTCRCDLPEPSHLVSNARLAGHG